MRSTSRTYDDVAGHSHRSHAKYGIRALRAGFGLTANAEGDDGLAAAVADIRAVAHREPTV